MWGHIRGWPAGGDRPTELSDERVRTNNINADVLSDWYLIWVTWSGALEPVCDWIQWTCGLGRRF